MVAYARKVLRLKPLDLAEGTEKLYSEFGEDPFINDVTILTTDAGHQTPDIGHRTLDTRHVK